MCVFLFVSRGRHITKHKVLGHVGNSVLCVPCADKQLDLTTVDLKKLKVKDLKKILEEWGESCKGCAEKSDFIRKITELMPKYAPAAAKARTDL